MTTPNPRDPNMDETTARFRAILAGDEEDGDEMPPTSQPASPRRSALDRLPRASKPADSAPQPTPARRAEAKSPKPAERVRAEEREPVGPSRKPRFGPAFWTITGTLSLIFNLALIVIVVILVGIVAKLNLKLNEMLALASLPEETVRGLYENFVKMDQAHIRASIPVTAEIPVQFNLDLNTQTEVVLSQDTPISQARVTLTTGGLNITNAPANIILPAGTRLPITLTLTVPVDKKVPVTLIVPVDIALSETDLHEPFVGLQTVVEPLYCLLNVNAASPDGALICEQDGP